MCVHLSGCLCLCVHAQWQRCKFKISYNKCKPSGSYAPLSRAVDRQTSSSGKSAQPSQGKLCIYQVPRRCQHKVKPRLSSCQPRVREKSSWSTSRSGCGCCYCCCCGCTSSIFLDSRTRWDCIRVLCTERAAISWNSPGLLLCLCPFLLTILSSHAANGFELCCPLPSCYLPVASCKLLHSPLSSPLAFALAASCHVVVVDSR